MNKLDGRQRWRPFDIPPELNQTIENFEHSQCQKTLDIELLKRSNILLNTNISQVAQRLIDREGLPHLAHLMCGWGNSSLNGASLLEHISEFIVIDEGRHTLLQNSEDGDFHPWQTFAYCMMADESLLNNACGEITLKKLMQNCTLLNTSNNTDLGHLLFAYSHIPKKDRPPAFHFDGEMRPLSYITNAAIEGHLTGGFEVCRKFHLTEGLCAISSNDEFKQIKGTVSVFLTGQLLSLKPLLVCTTILEKYFLNEELSNEEHETLNLARDTLVLGDAIENLFYYAGHLIELCGISLKYNYSESKDYDRHINSIINSLNIILTYISDDLNFAESFYAFAHYRRGIFIYLQQTSRSSKIDSTIEFSTLYSPALAKQKKVNIKNPYFSLAPPKQEPELKFLTVINMYNNQAASGFDARGEFKHFRKILPLNFPRGIHYEFLDFGDKIGIELHCEKRHLSSHQLFISLCETFNNSTTSTAFYDPDWYRGCGRILIHFPKESTDPYKIIKCMNELITSTYPELLTFYLKTSNAPKIEKLLNI